MIVEKLIFNLLAVSLIIIIFFKFIKNKEKLYLGVIGFECIGILINSVELFNIVKLNIFVKTLVYMLSIILPILLIILDNNHINISARLKTFKLKILLALKKDEEAKKYALKISDKYPRNYIIHRKLAELYEKEGKDNIALDEYIRAAELNEKDYEAQYKVGYFLEKTGKNEEAIMMLKDLIRVKPDYVEASLLLGDILYNEERFKEAVNVYAEALKYNPTKYELYYGLGMTFTRLNDFQRAKEFYEKAAELNTYLHNGQYKLALISMIQGELAEAEAYFMMCLQDEELEALSYYFLAQIALIKDDKEKAVNYINLALEIDKKIEEKIKKQPLFIAIQDKIKIPNEDRKIEIKLSEKEIKLNNYLEEMYNVVDALNGGKSSLFAIEEEQLEELEQEEQQVENEKERE